jgi:NitT/TauT family transport system permease protein
MIGQESQPYNPDGQFIVAQPGIREERDHLQLGKKVQRARADKNRIHPISRKNIFGKILAAIKGVAIVIIFFAVWEVLPRTGLVQAMFLPPATTVASAWIDLLSSGELLKHIVISLQRVAAGFGLSLAIIIPLGCLIGWYRSFERFIDPLVQAFRQTSALALFPVFILFFGIGEFSKIGMVFWAAQWPILLGTISGIRNVDPLLVDVARTLGIKELKLFIRIILPAAFPSIMTGIRLGAGASFLVLVAAEMIGAKSGLGFMIINAQYNFEIPQMYSAILTISLLGMAVNYLLVWIEKKAMAWKEEIVPT